MKLRKVLLTVIFSCSAAAHAAYEPNDTGDIFAKHIMTIGGPKVISKVRSIHAMADCSGPSGKYTTEIYSAGRKTIFKQVSDSGTYEGIVNSDLSWTSGAEPRLAGPKEAFVWRSHEFQWIAVFPLERFRSPRHAGFAEFDGKSVDHITATDELGRAVDVYLDRRTNLMAGFVLLDPFSGTEKIRITYNEWRRFGGVLLPSKVTATDKQGDFVLNFHTVKLNSVSDTVFEIPPMVDALKGLMDVHYLQRTAHFNRDAKLLVSIFADDFTEISDGRISRPKKDEAEKRFQSYFDAVAFIEWDDIEPPIISLSDDGRFGVMIVSKRVRFKTKGSDGQEREVTAKFAWTSTFKKIGSSWKMTSITSTTQAKK